MWERQLRERQEVRAQYAAARWEHAPERKL